MTDISLWLIGFCAGAVCLLWARRALDRWLRRRRAALAGRGERVAERLLRAQGWRIVERQARQRCTLRAGTKIIEFELIADLIVEKKKAGRMVAEVKTGAGRSISHSGTRRQLLEYLLAFDVDGVLLVDPTERRVTPIEFHLLTEK